jgi:nitroreductase
MKFEALIRKNRSYRRFYQNKKISKDILISLVNLARLSPSAGNLQPLRYIISNSPKKNDLIFSTLNWANYLRDWDGPRAGERPSAYIIILADLSISKFIAYDCGIASQSITLAATSIGLGGCNIASINKEVLRKNLTISAIYEILLVIALGEPKEKIILEESTLSKYRYFRDERGIHHVPKAQLKEIIIRGK